MATEANLKVVVDSDVMDEATRRYLRGDIAYPEYEEYLEQYLPSADERLRAFRGRRGVIARLARWLMRRRRE